VANRLEQENRLLRRDGFPELIAESQAMRPILQIMERIAPSDANVLVTGEHGTGKEVVARWIHAASKRREKPLVIVNAGGLPEGVFESELFGHVKGAFTDAKTDRVGRFELADGGTLFLDEIANIGLPQQGRLLRVLQTGELERVGSSRTRKVDVRVISATNADLRAEVAGGRFREDLLFRLNTIEIHLPRLRDRREDILPLAQHFLRRYSQRYARPRVSFSEDAVQALRAYEWPGNVRELDHAVERAVLLSQADVVDVWDLSLARIPGREAPVGGGPKSLDEMEKDAIKDALDRFDGNVSLAAKALGLSRSALYRRLQRHGLGEGRSDR
jgi:DNA-binding NtrC family response regulator